MGNTHRGRRGGRGGGRPHRGGGGDGQAHEHRGNVLVEGDTGIAAGPQHGAKPGASESGNLEAREFGVPQADIPGGLKHLTNPQTHPAPPIDKPPRPADYHKEHGVPPDDWGQYETPPDAGQAEADIEYAPEPRDDLAVPVYIVQREGGAKRLLALVTEGPVAFPSGTTDPIRLANRDAGRSKFWIANENTPSAGGATSPGVRIGDWETVADGRGLLIGAGQIKDFKTQDDVFMTNQSGTAITLSWGVETEIPAARSDHS